MSLQAQQFINAIKNDAITSAKLTQVFASFAIAEAALESAWGSSRLATQAHNLFGVKADKAWQGDTLSLPTREFLNNQWCFVNALWRKYPSWLGSFKDHADFLHHNPRYRNAFLAGNVEDFTVSIAKAGYATDPTYAKKIISIINQYHLKALDL